MPTKPTYDELEKKVRELEAEKALRKDTEAERDVHLRFLENMTRIDRAIQQTTDIEQMMSNVLQDLLEMFQCDRAWLLYPCDPEAKTWRVPVECTRPEYPGALALDEKIIMQPEEADILHDALLKDDVITIDSRDNDACGTSPGLCRGSLPAAFASARVLLSPCCSSTRSNGCRP